MDGLGRLRLDLSLKKAIVNAILRLLNGSSIYQMSPFIILGVGVRIACPNERGNARPGCGISGCMKPTLFVYILHL